MNITDLTEHHRDLLKKAYEDISNVSRDIVGSEALLKSCVDPFDYALKLKTGEVIIFSEAKVLSHEWIHLTLKPYDEQPDKNRVQYPADRGMDVRISEIVWVMDAPNGS